ncbi:hypothetical protein PG985_003709 [Apiospora marii]|uniref:uncharacterized protein n=1 Tax=Apiospora marii TaxID=335849 RepID=UPI00312F4A72
MSDLLSPCGFQAPPDLQVLLPRDPLYGTRESSYWAVNARLSPACIVQPKSTAQVSSLLKELVATGRQFAVRAGGHSPVPGANDIAGDGVTVDLGLLNSVAYDAGSETVRFGAGCRWRDVYGELGRHERTVPGGRGGDVGCDNVISYEIVLADGRTVTADKDTHVDLFRALKGGANNFGVVTSFAMRTHPSGRIWGGISASPASATDQTIRTVWNFTEGLTQDESRQDSYMLAVFGYFPAFGANVVNIATFQADGGPRGPGWDDWRALPKIMDTTGETTVAELAEQITLPPDYHNAWFTLTLRNDERLLKKATDVHERLVADLQAHVPDGDFITQCIFQPLPSVVAQRTAAAGGNVMGTERIAENAVLFSYSAMVRTAELARWVYPRLRRGLEEIRGFAAAAEAGGGLMDWLYMNYADSSQDVIGSYGVENVEELRRVAARYDPGQVFQKLCPGGWKIPGI